MKNFMIRSSVLIITIAGFTGSSMVTKVASKTPEIKPVFMGTMGPAPMCMPHDPTHCGLQ